MSHHQRLFSLFSIEHNTRREDTRTTRGCRENPCVSSQESVWNRDRTEKDQDRCHHQLVCNWIQKSTKWRGTILQTRWIPCSSQFTITLPYGYNLNAIQNMIHVWGRDLTSLRARYPSKKSVIDAPRKRTAQAVHHSQNQDAISNGIATTLARVKIVGSVNTLLFLCVSVDAIESPSDTPAKHRVRSSGCSLASL